VRPWHICDNLILSHQLKTRMYFFTLLDISCAVAQCTDSKSRYV